MKSFLFSILIFSSSTLQAVETTINFCYYNFREELATGAVLAGMKQGYFEKQGIKINLIDDQKVTLQTSEIIKKSHLRLIDRDRYNYGILEEIGLIHKTGEKDCDVTSINAEALILNKDNSDVQVLASYLYGTQYDTHLLVGQNSGVKTVADLKGKTVRLGRMPTYVLMRKILKEAGVNEADIKFVTSNPDVLVEKLNSKEYAGAIAYNPTTPLLLASDAAKVLVPNIFGTYLKPFIPSSVLITSKKALAQKRAAIDQFMTAFAISAKFISENPEEIVYALQGDKGNRIKYNYTEAQIEKSTSFMRISEPFYFSKRIKSSSPFSAADVRNGFNLYQQELMSLDLLKQKSEIDLQMIK